VLFAGDCEATDPELRQRRLESSEYNPEASRDNNMMDEKPTVLECEQG
jgi:hypothetical protein